MFCSFVPPLLGSGQTVWSLLANLRHVCRGVGHSSSPAASQTKNPLRKKPCLLTSSNCPCVPALLVMASVLTNALIFSILFSLLLDNQQECLCVPGSYIHRWAANRERSVVLQVVTRGSAWLSLWENTSERPEIRCVWLGKLSLCWSLQHCEYLLCTFLKFLLLWRAELPKMLQNWTITGSLGEICSLCLAWV